MNFLFNIQDFSMAFETFSCQLSFNVNETGPLCQLALFVYLFGCFICSGHYDKLEKLFNFSDLSFNKFLFICHEFLKNISGQLSCTAHKFTVVINR